MTAFPPGARNFQLPSPYRGVVFFHEGQLCVLMDGKIVLQQALPMPTAKEAVDGPVPAP